MSLGFLSDPAGFSLSEGWLLVQGGAPYWQVFAAGVLNTLKVALPAATLAALLGFVLGFGQLSKHPVLRACSKIYVNVFRNVPLLIVLLATYFAFTQFLPMAVDAWRLGDVVFLSKSGLAVPALQSTGVQYPTLGRFAVNGGWVLTPEYLSLLLALGLYTAAFVAEVVRSGVQAVKPGMRQAALALGLNAEQASRHVVMPLALRVMVPALSNQLLNLLKNASLGVAIGYPELVSVANTAMNQSGKAVECVLIILMVYLLLSLMASAVMNALNARVNRGAL
mgnify:CR=1 FL=1